MRSTPQRGLISSISGAFPGALEPPGLHGAYGYGACRYDRVGDVAGDVAAAAEIRPAAHVSEADASRMRVELDRDDGYTLYEVEFRVGRMEYEYKIDAYTGAVLQAENDYDD